jgi:hypothetical protein
MGQVLDFAEKVPALCDAEDADRWGSLIRFAYNNEKIDTITFARTDLDRKDPGRRLRIVFGFTAFKHNAEKATHCFNLLKLWELAHYRDEHEETDHDAEIADLWATAAEKETKYPEIAAVMSADTAASDGGW